MSIFMHIPCSIVPVYMYMFVYIPSQTQLNCLCCTIIHEHTQQLSDISCGILSSFPHAHSLNDLQEFIKVASGGLTTEVEEDDYDGLVGVMGHLLAVKDRQASTDTMFEPLKETLELLQSYDQVLPDEVHQQLEVMSYK